MHLYNNKLWVGTNKGVTEIFVEPSLGHPYVKRNINMDEGLISDYVYSIGVWREEVWVGTDKGLTVIPLSDGIVKRKKPYLNLLNFYSRGNQNVIELLNLRSTIGSVL
jgi:ligand-binding sensor domain-containing protein